MDERILEAVKKRAFGYVCREVTEEYAVNDGGETLTRRRVKTTEVPPDLAAVKMLTELMPEERGLSYNELMREKERLMREWLQQGGEESGNHTQ